MAGAELTNAAPSGPRPAVFFDRDGTLIEEIDHLGDPGLVTVLPGVPEALRRLRRAGYLLVVVSNQAGVAKGLISPDAPAAIARQIEKLAGLKLDAWYHCTHHPDAAIARLRVECDCRKPAPGLIEKAVTDLNIDAESSFAIGNMYHDILAANRAGVRAILVNTTPEKASTDPVRTEAQIWAVAKDIPDATAAILSSSRATSDES